MSLLLAIDPGVTLGWASFGNGLLYQCGLGETFPRTFQYNPVVIEKPQVYPHTSAKQANDLITLAIGVGELKRSLGDVELVLPHSWKGNTPKPIHHERVWRALSPAERDVVLGPVGIGEYISQCQKFIEGHRKTEPSSKWHNMFDAIALGLWKLRRL